MKKVFLTKEEQTFATKPWDEKDHPFVTNENKPHLGGYRLGGDIATSYPDLWDWVIKELDVKSVIDVGCGDGVSVKYFEKLVGFGNVLGVDGIPQEYPSIVEHDFTMGPFVVEREYDLCWCCEVVEHIEEQYLPNLLSTISKAQTVLMTHAGPGQEGHHHVNCRISEYWRGAMAAIGYRYDQILTAHTRGRASSNKSPYNHYIRSGTAFVRN